MYEILSRSAETQQRRRLRKEMPLAESYLWARLRASQVDGLKFRRQHSVGCYVLDFYCPSCKLAVELDGDSHDSEEAFGYDQRRTAYLNDFEIHVLRFPNSDIYQKLDQVIEQIAFVASTRSRPPLAPP